MYGDNQYGLTEYAQNQLSDDDNREYFVDLTKYVPPFISNTKEFEVLYKAEGQALGRLWYDMEDMQKQLRIKTAAWGLDQWEKEYGMETNYSLSYEQRREILLAKKRGQGTATKQMIKTVAESFSGGDVHVIEDNPHSILTIKFIGIKGIPQNMQAFIETLDDIKPAHLQIEFQYTYSVWDNFNNTWKEWNGVTWNDIKVK